MADEARGKENHSGRRSHRSRRHGHPQARRPSFFRRFWLEILAFLFLASGIFLLVERLKIKAILWGWILRVAEIVAAIGSAIGHWVTQHLITVEKSDLVGAGLILVALLMIASRLRARAIARHPPPVLKEECPKCSADMVRAPRRLSHRLLELALWIRIRRYACSKCSFRTASWHRLREEE
jgi:hypothetical protein